MSEYVRSPSCPWPATQCSGGCRVCNPTGGTREVAPLEAKIARKLAHKQWIAKGEPTAAAIVVLNQGLILVERGRNGTLLPGLPGGKREAGETTLQCARRELQEETGWPDSGPPISEFMTTQLEHRTEIFVGRPKFEDIPMQLLPGCTWEHPLRLLYDSRYPAFYSEMMAELVFFFAE